MTSALVICCLALVANARLQREASSVAAAANPIRKVVNLLKGMQKKVTEEGEAGQKLYDAFMCYCKSAGGDLEAGIKAADAKIPAVASTIKESEAKLAQSKAALKASQVDRSDAKAAMASASAIREKEAAAYAAENAVYETNIAAIKKAVASLEKGMGGAFLQTATAQAVRRLALDKQDMLDSDRQMLLSFLSGDASYAPSSGEVVGILKEMGDTMAKSSAEASAAESAALKSYQELMAAKTSEVEALTSSIEAKTTTIGDLGVSIVQMKNDLSESETGLMEDTAFLKDMDKSCATKTAEWEEAKKLRAEEMAALAETIKVLNDDDALDLFKKTLPSAGAASFMQMGSTVASMKTRTLAMLREARKASSAAGQANINLIMMAIRGKTGGFEKVIGLIDTMVATLKKEQLDDDHKKEYCLGQFDTTDDKKKALERSVADEEAAIAAAEEGVATLKEEIAALADGIKALDKSVAEATEQRKEESAEYTELMASDSTAKELLLFAKNRLNKFYSPKLYKAPPKRMLSDEDSIVVSMGGNLAPTAPPGGIAGTGISFAQVSAHLQRDDAMDAPPPPPESFEAYAKKSEESTGVITMIDMLVADLDKEMTESTTAEEDAQADYEEMMKDSAAKRATDVKTLSEKGSTQASLETDIEAHKDEKLSATKELMATLEYISSLHGECDWLLKYFDTRAEARTGEIDALGKAKDVLSGADYSLLQVKSRSLRGVRAD
jgi:septal ring factor EnvC (AmiA/AmiB activator)